MNGSIRSADQLHTSFSTEALQEIVRNCKRNEQSLHELIRHTRHERKRVERVLLEMYQSIQKHNKQLSTSLNNNPKPKPQKPTEFFISFDDDDNNNETNNDYDRRQNNYSFERPNNKKTILKEQDNKSVSSILRQSIHSDQSFVDNTHRVRFKIPENKKTIQTDNVTSSHRQKKTMSMDDELSDLARRCEDLLSRLHTDRDQVSILNNSNYYSKPKSYYSQNNQTTTTERRRPEFNSHSRQHLQNINRLREHNFEVDRECQPILPSSHSNLITNHTSQKNRIRLPLNSHEEKKKYYQLSEVSDRLRQRNY